MSRVHPRQYGMDSTFVMRDGTAVAVREATPRDRRELKQFAESLSEETIYFRFLTTGIDREVLAEELVPKAGCFAVIATKGDVVLGHASYCRYDSEAAEIGLLVIDGYQGLGLGTALVREVAKAANADGISVFEAVIGWNNTRMIRLVRNLGFPTSEKVEPELIRIRFPTSINPVSISEFQEKWAFTPEPESNENL